MQIWSYAPIERINMTIVKQEPVDYDNYNACNSAELNADEKKFCKVQVEEKWKLVPSFLKVRGLVVGGFKKLLKRLERSLWAS